MKAGVQLFFVLTFTAVFALAGDFWLFDGCPDVQRVNNLPVSDFMKQIITTTYWPTMLAAMGLEFTFFVSLWLAKSGLRPPCDGTNWIGIDGRL